MNPPFASFSFPSSLSSPLRPSAKEHGPSRRYSHASVYPGIPVLHLILHRPYSLPHLSLPPFFFPPPAHREGDLCTMPPRSSLTSSFSVTDANNEVVCPLKNNDGSNCRKRCLGVSASNHLFLYYSLLPPLLLPV